MGRKTREILYGKYELYSAIYEGLHDVRTGRTYSLDDVIKSLNDDFPDFSSTDEEIGKVY